LLPGPTAIPQFSLKEVHEPWRTRTADHGGGSARVARELLSSLAVAHVTLKPLPYDVRALEPHIGAETVALHYEQHHAGYVKKLNALIAGKPEETVGLDQLIRRSAGVIFDNAAQVWNHEFYWQSMHPDGGGVPEGDLSDAILRKFVSFERFRSDFLDAGVAHFGSGWLWLVSHRDRLRITTTPDADLPLGHDDSAILCVDLWEHAYYLDYRADRARYLESFVDHLADWEFARTNWEVAHEQWSKAVASTPILRQASR
jgi:Fe-Mn family superoxide dismutase